MKKKTWEHSKKIHGSDGTRVLRSFFKIRKTIRICRCNILRRRVSGNVMDSPKNTCPRNERIRLSRRVRESKGDRERERDYPEFPERERAAARLLISGRIRCLCTSRSRAPPECRCSCKLDFTSAASRWFAPARGKLS